MLVVLLSCGALIVLTTAVHYEILGRLNMVLFAIRIPNRPKLLAVILTAFVAHATEIFVYGVAYYTLVRYCGVGTLDGPQGFSLGNCLIFSAETYTSLGMGDVIPRGSIRVLAGSEALNGLLLVGWSASYAYIAMERFWKLGAGANVSVPGNGATR